MDARAVRALEVAERRRALTRADRPRRLLILGLGNVLCGDDGLGVFAVHMLARHYAPTPGVRLRAGGTLGLSLLPLFESAEHAILVDAIRSDAPPGSFVRIEAPEAASGPSRPFPHGGGLGDILDGVRRLARRPRRIVLLGLVPQTLDAQLGCSDDVEAALPRLVRAIVDEAALLGSTVRLRPRTPAPIAHSAEWAARILRLAGLPAAELPREPRRDA